MLEAGCYEYFLKRAHDSATVDEMRDDKNLCRQIKHKSPTKANKAHVPFFLSSESEME